MLRYVIKRLLLLIPVLLGATFFVFCIMELSPEDPAITILGADATQEAIEQLHHEMGLDQPLLVRYGHFIVRLLHGDLGNSYKNGMDVMAQIMDKLPNTLLLAAAGIFIAVMVGVPVGILSAKKQYSIFDTVAMIFTLILAASPAFWFGLVLVIIFSLKLGWFPSAGMGNGFLNLIRSLVLPAVTLCGTTAALVARTTRSSMLEVIRQDYIDTARAKGLKESVITMKHQLRNAMIPIITIVGLQFGVLLGGSVMTESVFSWPGIGRFVVEAVKSKDMPCVLGSVVMLSCLFTIVNLLVDILYGFIDPRIKAQYKR
ncbi:MAG: ABC transporter permease [Pyramidobacter sp.]|jgi:peptide/nickel transport system permease protein